MAKPPESEISSIEVSNMVDSWLRLPTKDQSKAAIYPLDNAKRPFAEKLGLNFPKLAAVIGASVLLLVSVKLSEKVYREIENFNTQMAYVHQMTTQMLSPQPSIFMVSANTP